MKLRFSISAFIFGLLLALSAIYVAALFSVNFSLFSALETAQQSGAPLSDVAPLFNRTVANGLLSVLVILTCFLLVTTVLLLRLVIFPIRRLRTAFHKLTSGDLNASVEPEGTAELVHIGFDFNEATKTVRTKTEALTAAKLDLQEANERLEAEFTEAKKLNDLTVGRELAMVKMKEELELVRKQLADRDSRA